MIPNSPVARFLRKAGWCKEAIQATCNALRYDTDNCPPDDRLAKQLWTFVASLQREAVLNALAKDALDREKLARHYEQLNANPYDHDAWQLRLDELLNQVADQRDPGDPGHAPESPQ